MQRRERPSTRPYLRHLQGWELGLVALTIAALGVVLVVPIAVVPEEIPLPLPNGSALSATLIADAEAAAQLASGLAADLARRPGAADLYDLRAVGASLRTYGRAESQGDTYAIVRARRALQENVVRARALGDDRLLALRAYQGAEFARELTRYENSGVVSEELTGLAGPFVALMSRYGWSQGRIVTMDEVLRSTFWKRRWNEVTGLGDGPFALTLDEQRAFYAFLLRHPVLEDVQSDAKVARRARDAWSLRKVDELARLDPTYPALLARGVLLYRLGRYPESADSFRGYLAASADPPYALRARNYLMASLARVDSP